jgi:hypothetical protein
MYAKTGLSFPSPDLEKPDEKVAEKEEIQAKVEP